MKDLISRQAAIKAFYIQSDDDGWWVGTAQDAETLLNGLPTAERVGKWIRHPEVKNIYGGVYIECSECREKYVVQYVEDEKFCPNCGARMSEDGKTQA